MVRRGIPGGVLIALILLIVASAITAVIQYPPFFSQPAALRYLLEPAGILLVYAVGAIWWVRGQGTAWETVRQNATVFGLVSGWLEVLNIGIEDAAPVFSSHAWVPIGFMLMAFSLWGVAGFRAARECGSVRRGVLAAVASAAICMLFAVAAGFLIQVF